ncbi:hypothetical protein OIE62_19390 [Streptomyces scopuliridis]|uniref:Uncharacterized protein n=1 Tax=Streptomyces scopuliridis TaxID=452529 RepID=A0ACD4ZNG4_9ACTN|nr:hypothetical protein [Streptomyces scopuliridis]WSB99337.1 hypothetical protein OG835_21560 [Streptomyces scopuliridis]WSC06962.1 hypothetical protein OIE62_19390 [Streptomyces scopuliridis]
MSLAGPEQVDRYETRVPDAEGWRGVPFRHPAEVEADSGKHDGGPMPPEAPRAPQPQPQEGYGGE